MSAEDQKLATNMVAKQATTEAENKAKEKKPNPAKVISKPVTPSAEPLSPKQKAPDTPKLNLVPVNSRKVGEVVIGLGSKLNGTGSSASLTAAYFELAADLFYEVDPNDVSVDDLNEFRYVSADPRYFRAICEDEMNHVAAVVKAGIIYGCPKDGAFSKMAPAGRKKLEEAWIALGIQAATGHKEDPTFITMARVISGFPDVEYLIRKNDQKLVDLTLDSKYKAKEAKTCPKELQFTGAPHCSAWKEEYTISCKECIKVRTLNLSSNKDPKVVEREIKTSIGIFEQNLSNPMFTPATDN